MRILKIITSGILAALAIVAMDNCNRTDKAEAESKAIIQKSISDCREFRRVIRESQEHARQVNAQIERIKREARNGRSSESD
jgi:hypothetical protein